MLALRARAHPRLEPERTVSVLRKGEAMTTVSPLRGEWRCSNCAMPATPDIGTLVDARYALGHCDSCSLRASVPLMRGTYEPVKAMVDEREDGNLRQKQQTGLRVGSIPTHVYVSGCCKVKKGEHLTVSRLERLGWTR